MTRSEARNSAYQPIAIVGIGCRFPGGIVSPKSFWDFLMRGGDGTSEVPESRWDADKHYDPERGKPGKLYTKRGGFLDDVRGFDPQFFGISPREAAYMDPQQRLLLETTWEAFEDAGIAPPGLERHKVGVFVGLFTHDYENVHMRTSELHLQSSHSATGMSTTISANRLSFAFDFMGPSMIIDTACSSSLVAAHLACRALQTGEAEIAIAGGVNLQLSPEMTMALCNASMLAPDGRCKSFDSRANGYARADGVGVVVLKTLDQAQADGDAIYAVIHGSAVNQDGHSSGLTVPNGEAQKIVMRDALDAAALSGTDLSYVEAHGTGTPVGDPIEANALGTVLSADSPDRAPCVIGSVKSNFGHTESAAGVAGLIKVALMQHHGRIPANLHLETPNPKIPFEDLRVRVPTASEDWPSGPDGQRFAGINSFGFGGTNAHVIVGKAPAPANDDASDDAGHGATILALSARAKPALTASAAELRAFLASESAAGIDLGEIGAGLALGRSHHAERLIVAASDTDAAIALLDGFVAGNRQLGIVSGTAKTTGRLAFVCSGMGQQWWGMGRGLMASEPVFAAKVAEVDALFGKLSDEHTLAELFAMDEEHSEINKTQYAQRAIFAVQVGLAALWESIGVRPDFVVGHSVGEVAASYIAGALSLEDAVLTSFHRSRLQARLAGRGGMLAVGLPEQDVRPYLAGIEDKVSMGAINSPDSVTLAGDETELKRLLEGFEARQIFARMLNVEVPYHSPVMDEINDEFRAELKGLAPRDTVIPLVSTVTGKLIAGTELIGQYWIHNTRDPVNFRQAMATLAEEGCTGFVELSAHPVLATSINECLAADKVEGTAIASLRRKQDDTLTFWSGFGQLHCAGYEVPFGTLFRRTGKRIDLPTYAWQNEEFWMESAESHRNRTGTDADDAPRPHPLLGGRQTAPQPTWRADIAPDRPAYLKDHRVDGSVVFPAAGYVEAALAAFRDGAGGEGGLALKNFVIEAPLILDGLHAVALQTRLGSDGKIEVHSLTGKPGDQHWMRHAAAVIAEPSDAGMRAPIDVSAANAGISDAEDSESFYARFDGLDLDYGPRFRNIETAWVGTTSVLGRFRDAEDASDELADYLLHPALLDTAFQLVAGLPEKGTYLPVGFDGIEVFAPGQAIAYAQVTLTGRTHTRVKADILVADQSGALIAAVDGLTLRLFDNSDRSVRMAEDDYFYASSWLAEPLLAKERHGQPSVVPADFASMLDRLQTRRDGTGIVEPGAGTDVDTQLDALAGHYFTDALIELGWSLKPGQTISLDMLSDRLGLRPEQRDFVARMLVNLAQTGMLVQADNGWQVADLPEGPAHARWRELVRAHPHYHAELAMLRRCGDALAAILSGQKDAQTTLFPEDCPVVEHLFTDAPSFRPANRRIADLVGDVVSHLPQGRSLRILEIGAGTGGLSAHVLPLLPAERVSYVLTDASDAAIAKAQQRFRSYGFVHAERFDPGADPEEQGFDKASFDLVLAGGAPRNAAGLGDGLDQLPSLLTPGGLLALAQPNPSPAWFDLVFGLLPDWRGVAETEDAPPSARDWRDRLAKSGFSASGVIGGETAQAGPLTVFVAQKPVAASAIGAAHVAPEMATDARPVIILEGAGGNADALAAALEARGARPHVVAAKGNGVGLVQALENIEAADEGAAPIVIDVRPMRAPSGDDAAMVPSEAATRLCTGLQNAVLALADRAEKARPTLWVVTAGAAALGSAAKAPDLVAAAARGFARSAMNEHGDVDTRLADLSPTPDPQEFEALAREVLSDSHEAEIALRGHERYVGRVHRWRDLVSTDNPDALYELRKSSWPAPNDLTFHEAELPPPGPNEVQMRVEATGVNFKDFALLSGLVSEDAGENGLEGSGTVLAVGPGVTDFAPGDRVFGTVIHGFNAVINTSAIVLAHMPKTLDFEQAAGVPVVFLSAYHALSKQANLSAGETVLVHTAASGLGLAAIAVARMLGARVFATAGTPEKRAYLKALGVDYVGDSRSAAFAREIDALTDGAGVDVILNTLPAALNAHNLKLLRPGTGRLIDVANVHYEAQLDLRAFARGVSVTGFDLTMISRENPEYVGALMRELADLFASGALRPIPYRAASIERLSEVLHSVRRATHIGKLVITHRDAHLNVVPEKQALPLRADAAYLLTGGLTGFGIATAKWLANCGARHLVLAGRRGAATPGAAEVLDELAHAGVHVEAVACDIAERADVAALIDRFGADLPPLAGIIHGAMVLRDGPLRAMSDEDIHSVLAPKLDGAHYLDELTRDRALDFFVCHSSISSLAGNRDQANYAAANAALEELMASRRANGRAGLAIGWGMLGEIGVAARERDIMDVFVRQGIFPLSPDKAWTAVAAGIGRNLPYLSAIVVDWRQLGKFARAVSSTPRFAALAGSGGRAGAGSADTDGAEDGGGGFENISALVVHDIAGVLGMAPEAVDVEKPLPELGFDSLMAVELSVALEHSTGHGFNRMSLLRPDLTAAELIAVIEAERGGDAPAEPANGSGAKPEPAERDLSDLSDAEVDAMLRELSAGE